MSRINITGMLDRDHALTAEGIKQASELNAKWIEAKLNDAHTYNDMNNEVRSCSMVPEMFDFSRMDENEELQCSPVRGGAAGNTDAAAGEGSDSEGEEDEDDLNDSGSDDDDDDEEEERGGGGGGGGVKRTTRSPVNRNGKGFGKIYDSFFLKRLSITTGIVGRTAAAAAAKVGEFAPHLSHGSPEGGAVSSPADSSPLATGCGAAGSSGHGDTEGGNSVSSSLLGKNTFGEWIICFVLQSSLLFCD